MCMSSSSVGPYAKWNWDGDYIVPEPVIEAMRRVPETKERYDIDIREFLVTTDNAVMRAELRGMFGKLAANDRAKFASRVPGAFDFRVHVILEHLASALAYIPGSRKFDTWQVPDETLKRKGGDCEDIAFLVASLLLASGISGYNVRVALGYFVDTQGGGRHAHAWVMYKNEEGYWSLLDPVALVQRSGDREAAVPAKHAIPSTNRYEYEPRFLFNAQHLWRVRQTACLLKDYLAERKFWKWFSPAFAIGVHQDVLYGGLVQSGILSKTWWMIYNQTKAYAVNAALDANPLGYQPSDHCDNAYIVEGWNSVEARLKTGSMTDLFKACHTIADFYAHSSYAHFAAKATPAGQPVPIYDPATRGMLAGCDYSAASSFNLQSYSPNPPACVDKAAAQAFWSGKIISGRYAQPNEPFRSGSTVDDAFEQLVKYPDALKPALDNNRTAIPHHDQIAVDSDTMSAAHQLYADPAKPGETTTAYSEQFTLRKELAIRHIATRCKNWG